MSESVSVKGVVSFVMPIGENDRRITLITRERGKINAFARGARNPRSSFGAACEPFCFGSFILAEGRSSYSLIKAEPVNYFRELAANYEAACMGYYLLELASWFSVENVEAGGMVDLLYLALNALLSEAFDNRLVRRITELKLLSLEGEYPDPERYAGRVQSDTLYTMRFIVERKVKELFTFRLSEEILRELSDILDDYFLKNVRHEFKSLRLVK